MKKKFLSVALVCALTAGLTLPSCIGSFSLTNKLLSWNRGISNKFVNELVFVCFWILPVYEVSGLADILVINSIEFWSGSSPIAKGKSVIEGQDGKYLVDCDGKGYTITRMDNNESLRLNFDQEEQTWSVATDQGEYTLFTWVDDTHMKLPTADGGYQIVEASQQGLYAYQSAVLGSDNLTAQR